MQTKLTDLPVELLLHIGSYLATSTVATVNFYLAAHYCPHGREYCQPLLCRCPSTYGLLTATTTLLTHLPTETCHEKARENIKCLARLDCQYLALLEMQPDFFTDKIAPPILGVSAYMNMIADFSKLLHVPRWITYSKWMHKKYQHIRQNPFMLQHLRATIMKRVLSKPHRNLNVLYQVLVQSGSYYYIEVDSGSHELNWFPQPREIVWKNVCETIAEKTRHHPALLQMLVTCFKDTRINCEQVEKSRRNLAMAKYQTRVKGRETKKAFLNILFKSILNKMTEAELQSRLVSEGEQTLVAANHLIAFAQLAETSVGAGGEQNLQSALTWWRAHTGREE